jgi:hypothetical protein
MNFSMALFIRFIIRLFQLQPEQCFSLTINQSTVFFSWLISTAERGLYMGNGFHSSVYASRVALAVASVGR